MDGSASRTYFAAVAPPQPPPTTTTRRPLFGAKSPFIPVAHPPNSPTPSPTPDARRKSRRVISLIGDPPSTSCGHASLQCAESPGLLVPGGDARPRRHHDDDQDECGTPAERRRQEDRRPQLAHEPGRAEAETGERRGQREGHDGDPQLQL